MTARAGIERAAERRHPRGIGEHRRDRDDRHDRRGAHDRHQNERHQRAGAIARDAAGDCGNRRQRGDQYKFCKRDVREKQGGFNR
jgi:hypothetical protein